MSDIYERLRRPFAETSIEYVVTFTYGDSYADVMIGVAPYIKRESIITRLDHVVGADRWKNEILPVDYGLFNGLSINTQENNWITKYDGAAMGKDGGEIDRVKAVATFSFRRCAELWGIGKYLKDLPTLFAVKRPDNYYDADEFTKVNRKINNQHISFKVRWDHPPIPAEFLPTYMTPEQYYLLQGLKKYFTSTKEEVIEETLSKWKENNDSVSYEEAKSQIERIQMFISSRYRAHNSKTIYAPEAPPPPPKKDPKPKVQDTKPPAPKVENTPTPPPEKKPPVSPDQPISKLQYATDFRDLKKLIKDLLERDLVGMAVERDPAKADIKRLEASAKQKKPIPHAEIKEMLSYYSRAMVDLTEKDDDLPF